MKENLRLVESFFGSTDSEGSGFSFAVSLVFFCLLVLVFSLFVVFGGDFLARFGGLTSDGNRFCASGLSTAFLFVVFFETFSSEFFTRLRDFCFGEDTSAGAVRFREPLVSDLVAFSTLVAFFGTFFLGRTLRGARVFFGVGA